MRDASRRHRSRISRHSIRLRAFYNVGNDLAAIVTDTALLAGLRNRFESYTGDVKNRGGIR
jgi:hypothetical protein